MTFQVISVWHLPNDWTVIFAGLVSAPQATPTKAVQFTFTDHSHDHDPPPSGKHHSHDHDPPPSGKHHNHDRYTPPRGKHENNDKTTREGAVAATGTGSEAEGKPQRACKGKRYKEMVAESGLKSFKRERKVMKCMRLV